MRNRWTFEINRNPDGSFDYEITLLGGGHAADINKLTDTINKLIGEYFVPNNHAPYECICGVRFFDRNLVCHAVKTVHYADPR